MYCNIKNTFFEGNFLHVKFNQILAYQIDTFIWMVGTHFSSRQYSFGLVRFLYSFVIFDYILFQVKQILYNLPILVIGVWYLCQGKIV